MKSIALCALALLASCGGKDDGDKKDRKGRDRGGDDDEDPVLGYKKKAKKSEAMIQLDKISKRAKEEFHVNGAFPVAKLALTPGETCCVQDHEMKKKCAPKASNWSGDWRKLDFSIDEPHYFQYSYESDGKTFTAKAVGDLDCDTTMITYEAQGSALDGKPSVQITEPAPNSD
jgi:hypothetical protein